MYRTLVYLGFLFSTIGFLIPSDHDGLLWFARAQQVALKLITLRCDNTRCPCAGPTTDSVTTFPRSVPRPEEILGLTTDRCASQCDYLYAQMRMRQERESGEINCSSDIYVRIFLELACHSFRTEVNLPDSTAGCKIFLAAFMRPQAAIVSPFFLPALICLRHA